MGKNQIVLDLLVLLVTEICRGLSDYINILFLIPQRIHVAGHFLEL